MRILKSRSFILAAGLFALLGALLFAGGAFTSASKGAGDTAASSVGFEDNSCEKIHTLFRRKAPDGQKLRQEACCPALPGRAAPASTATGIQ